MKSPVGVVVQCAPALDPSSPTSCSRIRWAPWSPDYKCSGSALASRTGRIDRRAPSAVLDQVQLLSAFHRHSLVSEMSFLTSCPPVETLGKPQAVDATGHHANLRSRLPIPRAGISRLRWVVDQKHVRGRHFHILQEREHRHASAIVKGRISHHDGRAASDLRHEIDDGLVLQQGRKRRNRPLCERLSGRTWTDGIMADVAGALDDVLSEPSPACGLARLRWRIGGPASSVR